MQIRIICIGKINEKELTILIDNYLKKIKTFNKISIIELEEKTFSKENSDTINKSLKQEAILIKPYLENSYNIALCIEAQLICSKVFASKLENIFSQSNAYKYLNFIIGSSHGLDPSIKHLCDLKISLSELTFPHQLVRLILLEQIYRCFSIINNTKYHK